MNNKNNPPPMRALFSEPTASIDSIPQESGAMRVHIRARSRGTCNSPFFGETIHDFSTLTMPPEIAIDDSHGVEIGKGKPYLTEYGIEIDGEIFPNHDNVEHNSNRIIYNLKNGIPQQASIDFTGRWDAEILHEKMETQVNGNVLSGPAVIIRNWTLRSVAICKEGMDNSTSVDAKFSAENYPDCKYTLKTKENSMPEEPEKKDQPAPAPETPPEPGKAPDDKEKKTLEDLSQTVAGLTQTVESLSQTVAGLTQKMSAIPQLGTPPVTPPEHPPVTSEKLWEQYRQIKDPAEKTLFYRKHKDVMG